MVLGNAKSASHDRIRFRRLERRAPILKGGDTVRCGHMHVRSYAFPRPPLQKLLPGKLGESTSFHRMAGKFHASSSEVSRTFGQSKFLTIGHLIAVSSQSSRDDGAFATEGFG